VSALQHKEDPKGRLDRKVLLVRLKAAQCLGRIGDARAVNSLVEFLDDGDSRFNQALVEALSRIGQPAIVALRAASENQNDRVKASAWDALAAIGDQEALQPLIELLQHGESIGSRSRAARALGNIGDPRSIEVCVHACGV
jgi:HEAT repeat protein